MGSAKCQFEIFSFRACLINYCELISGVKNDGKFMLNYTGRLFLLLSSISLLRN